MPQYGMGFNNPYGLPPQNSYYNPQYNSQHSQYNNTNQTQSFAYVNGIEGAKAYPMLANQNILLMDVENPVFYMKTSNAMGQAAIKTYRFEEVTETTPSNVSYVTKTEFDELKTKFEEFLKGVKDNG